MGVIPLSPQRQPRNSEEFRSATGTCHRVDGRLMVRQSHWEGSSVSGMGRREFVALLGGAAAAWPLAARAQQATMRTLGYLSARSSEVETELVRAFQQGLRETGYAEGKNITVEYRWAEGRYDRLPALANELVDRQAAVIVTTGGSQPARAVLAATSTIPLVFTSGSDPVTEGLVKRFDRPDGNATGVHAFTASLGPKRLQLLRELVPNA